MATALVTGASGFVGSHLVERLLQEGMKVTCLVRPEANLIWLKGLDVKIIRADLKDVSTLSIAVKKKNFIYHVAGLSTASTDDEYYQNNVKGTVNLLKSVLRFNPHIKHFIYISSIAVSGPSRKYQPLTEESESHPISPYGQSKLSAEETVIASQAQIPVTIVRPPVVFGPRDVEVLRLIKLVKMSIHPVLGLQKRVYSMIYVKDLVDGVVKLTNQDIAKGELYYFSNNEPVTWHELIRILQKVLNKKGIYLYSPIWAFRLFIYLHDMIAKMIGRQTLFNIKRIHELLAARWECLPSKIRKDLQISATTPLEKAIQQTIEWYQDEGWLS